METYASSFDDPEDERPNPMIVMMAMRHDIVPERDNNTRYDERYDNNRAVDDEMHEQS